MLLIVPDKMSNTAEPLYGEMGAGSSWLPQGSERVTEPWYWTEGSNITSPKEVSDRLNFAAIGLRSSVLILITSETKLKEFG
jgi:hypothetical protein